MLGRLWNTVVLSYQRCERPLINIAGETTCLWSHTISAAPPRLERPIWYLVSGSSCARVCVRDSRTSPSTLRAPHIGAQVSPTWRPVNTKSLRLWQSHAQTSQSYFSMRRVLLLLYMRCCRWSVHRYTSIVTYPEKRSPTLLREWAEGFLLVGRLWLTDPISYQRGTLGIVPILTAPRASTACGQYH